MDAQDDLERQMRELERDKRVEEIKQLRASSRTRWITPAALAALLPLLAGFGIWVVTEVKQYNEGYRALAERDALRLEKDALQRQKDSLNTEISTLLQLKTHYAGEAERLQRDTVVKQEAIDKYYLRGVFSISEALYALNHIKGMGPAPNRAALQGVRAEIRKLPPNEARIMGDVLERYELSQVVIQASNEVITEFRNTLEVVPAAEWTKELRPMPTGAVIGNRKVMVAQQGSKQRYYDVTEGRFLNAKEAEQAH